MPVLIAIGNPLWSCKPQITPYSSSHGAVPMSYPSPCVHIFPTPCLSAPTASPCIQQRPCLADERELCQRLPRASYGHGGASRRCSYPRKNGGDSRGSPLLDEGWEGGEARGKAGKGGVRERERESEEKREGGRDR